MNVPIEMKIKKCCEDAIIPTQASDGSAGYDLYASEGCILWPHTACNKVPTGIAVEIPRGYFGGVFARSGLAAKHGLGLTNGVGVIDSDYRGEICVLLENESGSAYTVKKGDRIGQLIIMPYQPVEFHVVDDLDDTDRGAGGFGSTGV